MFPNSRNNIHIRHISQTLSGQLCNSTACPSTASYSMTSVRARGAKLFPIGRRRLRFMHCRVYVRTCPLEERSFMLQMESDAANTAAAVVALSRSDADYIETHLMSSQTQRNKVTVRKALSYCSFLPCMCQVISCTIKEEACLITALRISSSWQW